MAQNRVIFIVAVCIVGDKKMLEKANKLQERLVKMCKRVAKEKIKILVLEVGKKPWVKEIKNISDIYSLVYFPYIEVPISENLVVIASNIKDPALENYFRFNRKIRDKEIYRTLCRSGKK